MTKERKFTVGKWRAKFFLIIAIALCVSVLTGYLLGTLANRWLPVKYAHQEVETAPKKYNRLI